MLNAVQKLKLRKSVCVKNKRLIAFLHKNDVCWQKQAVTNKFCYK